MLKGYKHTFGCKCGESTLPFEDYDKGEAEVAKKKSPCCNSGYEYMGFRPYYENILKVPFQMAEKMELTQEEKSEEETTEVVEPMIEVPVTKVEPKVEEVVEPVTVQTTSTNLTIDQVIQPNAKGKVLNGMMIPVLKAAVEEGSKEKVALLKTHYPEVFESSVKYIPAKLQAKLRNELL